MKIFFDESGNSGCIIPNRSGALYNDYQRFFVLGGIICKNKQDENLLKERYLLFKKKHQLQGEIKGSDLMKRENNDLLLDFIETMLDDSHFYICCYDKLFYIAALITNFFYPRELMVTDPLFFFTQMSALSREDASLFLKYCECNALGTETAALDFCRFVVSFDFKNVDRQNNGYIEMAKLALENGNAYDFPLPFGSYCNKKYTHLINLTALGETLLAIKQIYRVKTASFQIVHDHIKEFENEYYDSLQEYNVDLRFCDSKDELLLQYADNLASIFRKCFAETWALFQCEEQWNPFKKWFPENYAKILKKITYNNIKWDTAIPDQVLPLCIEKMFSADYPIELRNNICFNRFYAKNEPLILKNIISAKYNQRL